MFYSPRLLGNAARHLIFLFVSRLADFQFDFKLFLMGKLKPGRGQGPSAEKFKKYWLSCFKPSLFSTIYLQNISLEQSFRQEVNQFVFDVKNIEKLSIRTLIENDRPS